MDHEKIKEEDLGLVTPQIAFWDEKHIEQVVGEHRDHTYQFGYDNDGIYSEEVEAEVFQKVIKQMYNHCISNYRKLLTIYYSSSKKI